MFFGPLLVLGLIVLIVSGVTKDSQPTATTDALGILRRRYARDEIDGEEFESRRRMLEERT